MAWYLTFDSAFWITITTIVVSAFGLAIKYCLKSKCDNVNCCYGCFTLHRNVELETEEEMKTLELGQSNNIPMNIA